MPERGRGIVWTGAWTVFFAIAWARAEGGGGRAPTLIMDSVETRENVLEEISMMSTGNLGTTCTSEHFYKFVKAPMDVAWLDPNRQKADLLVRILEDVVGLSDAGLLERMVESLVASDEGISAGRLLLTGADGDESPSSSSSSFVSLVSAVRSPPSGARPRAQTATIKASRAKAQPWYGDALFNSTSTSSTSFQERRVPGSLGLWTYPYFQCRSRRWILSYTAPLMAGGAPSPSRSLGVVSFDVDVTSLDVDQCDARGQPDGVRSRQEEEEEELLTTTTTSPRRISYFVGTHKCDRNSSVCVFSPGHGWKQGGYRCRCRTEHFPREKAFNGTLVEVAWKGKVEEGNPAYDVLYVCRPCPEDCPDCTSDRPCNAKYNWPFRIALLTISSLCMVFTFVLMAMVYHYRSVKVFRLASPTFLCICLIGCSIMYLEMAAIFPVLDTYSCVATKWTRHLGFCVTFSSLLMKTWRVSLTYRVTSAHKIKLTDKQLLQWLTPILLIVLVYLLAWTISATPGVDLITDYGGLKFRQCTYDWWDHSLAVGEVLFLMWGVKVCFSVRKAESFFDEAKYISWAVYNIAVVNIVMVSFHLIIFPEAGPNIKFLLGFLRTQLSTSTTVLLIFGPKFYRIVRGTGDQYDNRARAKGVTASFSLNGLGVMNEEPADLSQENEELKEEIQKLAAQMEFMKIVHMEVNNRHLKPKPGGYFSSGEKNNTSANTSAVNTSANTSQSPCARGRAPPEGQAENSSFRLSPAAEMASERV